MVDFVLKDDGVVSSCHDYDVLFLLRLIRLDGDFVMPDDVALVLLVDGEAAFPGIEVGFSDRSGGDFRINELIFRLSLDLSVFSIDGVGNDEHSEVGPHLRGGEPNAFSGLGVALSEFGVLGGKQIIEHLIDEGLFFLGEGARDFFATFPQAFGWVFNDFQHGDGIIPPCPVFVLK